MAKKAVKKLRNAKKIQSKKSLNAPLYHPA